MIQFSKATVNDLDQLSQLVNSAYRGDSSRQGWTTEADLLGGQRTDPQSLKEQIDDPGSELILMRDNGDLVACAYIKQLSPALEMYLGMLTVRPDLQARGYGRQLLQYIEEFAKKNNYRKIIMDVIEQRQELISYYQRKGFILTGKYKSFPYGDERFGIPKRKDLRFVLMEKIIL